MDEYGLGRKPLAKVEDFDRKYRKPLEYQSFLGTVRSWLQKKRSKLTCRKVLLSNFPIIESMRSYRPKRDLPKDVISGLTVGVMHIPQGMAYATLARLPPIVGLYVALISSVVYVFLGGTRQASFGVIGVVGLMMGSVVSREIANGNIGPDAVSGNMTATADYNDDQKIELASAVSFISGLFLIVSGKLGFGFVTTYMPDALIRGFTTGAATHVVISQTSNVLGIKITRQNGALKAIMTVIEIFKHLTDTNWVTLVFSISAMTIMYVVKVHVNQRFSKKLKIPIPIELIVMILSVVGSKYSNLYADYGVKIVGKIPSGFPAFKIPDLNLARSSIMDSVVIGVVAFAQSVALAKTFSIKNGYKIDANQEMFAYGACSVATSLFSGFVAAASMARSLVQDGTGGVSQIASLVGCLIVLMVILFIGPLFYDLPTCVLSSVIIVNLRGMLRQFLLLKPYWKQSKPDFLVFLVTYLAVVIIDIDVGLGVGIIAAAFSVVVRTQRAGFVELGPVDDLEVYKPVNLYNKTFTSSTSRVLRFNSPLYFANVDVFQDRIYKLLDIDINQLKKEKLGKFEDVHLSETNHSPQNGVTGNSVWNTTSNSNLRHVILDLSCTTFIDTMGAKTLKQVILDLEFVDIQVYVAGLPETSYHVLKSTDVWAKCSGHFYLTVNDVVRTVTSAPVTCDLEGTSEA